MCCTKFNSIWRRHRQGTWKKNELGQQWITEAKIFQCQKEQQQQTVAMNRTCELPFLKNVTYLVVEWLLETLVLGSRYQKYSDRRSSTTSSINVLRFIQQCWMLFLTFFVYSLTFRSRKLQNFEKSSKMWHKLKAYVQTFLKTICWLILGGSTEKLDFAYLPIPPLYMHCRMWRQVLWHMILLFTKKLGNINWRIVFLKNPRSIVLLLKTLRYFHNIFDNFSKGQYLKYKTNCKGYTNIF